MRRGIVGSLAVLVVGGSLGLAQEAPGPALPSPVSEVPGPLAPQDGDRALPAVAPEAPGERVWVGAEYLLWWLKRTPLPAPLVTTTSDLAAVPPAAFLQSGTSTLLGDDRLNPGVRSGGRFEAGVWIDDHRTISIEGSCFFLESHTVTQGVASSGEPGSPLLAVPFFDADAQAESSFLLAAPGALSGGAALSVTSRLQGAEVDGAVAVLTRPWLRLEVLAGFRYLDFRENLTFTTTSVGIQAPAPGSNNGLVLNTQDQFDSHDLFFGPQVGARAECRLGNLFVEGTAKLAIGDVNQTTTIAGSATTNFFIAPPGGPFTGVSPQVVPGSGTFAQPSNTGQNNRHQIAWVPEVGVKVGYQLAPWARAFVGYEFLYASNFARPGEQIDRGINTAQTVQSAVAGNPPAPGTRPMVSPGGAVFWAQGIDVGLELRY
ncbi:MAG TPA: BBP7 family outer membrane beta-barrel protein [Gemmataceae bacterium]|nr:BBP7 family outer membrane beta-barrel protein [Gemmataceae bacterium]